MEKVLILMTIMLLLLLPRIWRQEFVSPAVINLYWNIFFIFGAVILLGGETQWQYGGIVWILFSCCT